MVYKLAWERKLSSFGALNIGQVRDRLFRTYIRMNKLQLFPSGHSFPGDSNSWKNKLAGSFCLSPYRKVHADCKQGLRLVPVDAGKADSDSCLPVMTK